MLQKVNKKIKIKKHEGKYVVEWENSYRLWLLDNQKVEEISSIFHEATDFSTKIFEQKQGE